MSNVCSGICNSEPVWHISVSIQLTETNAITFQWAKDMCSLNTVGNKCFKEVVIGYSLAQLHFQSGNTCTVCKIWQQAPRYAVYIHHPATMNRVLLREELAPNCLQRFLIKRHIAQRKSESCAVLTVSAKYPQHLC